jgi:glutaredoxin-related protein
MKKIFLFGSQQCPDCIAMKEALETAQIRYSYIDVLDSLGKLKMFLKYRDALPGFEQVRANNGVGIPFLLVNDGEWTSLEAPSEELIARLKE